MKSKYAKFIKSAKETDSHWAELAISDFTDDLLMLMEKQNITRAELAKRINTSRPYVSNVLNGYENLTLATMAKLARALGTIVRVHLAPPEAIVKWRDLPASTDVKVEFNMEAAPKPARCVCYLKEKPGAPICDTPYPCSLDWCKTLRPDGIRCGHKLACHGGEK
jgi:transcriptional regulator with XRE-family HTH domain